jgi:hypothetical protein
MAWLRLGLRAFRTKFPSTSNCTISASGEADALLAVDRFLQLQANFNHEVAS